VIGFSKIPNKYGSYLAEVRFKLKPIKLDFLWKLFNIDLRDTSPEADPYLFGSYEINKERAKALQPYVIDGVINLEEYGFELSSGSRDTRKVVGYSKVIKGKDPCVEYTLSDAATLRFLQQLFNIHPKDKDRLKVNVCYAHEINEKQARALQPYVKDGIIDLEQYDFMLEYYSRSVCYFGVK
jgi:hypothetical protein